MGYSVSWPAGTLPSGNSSTIGTDGGTVCFLAPGGAEGAGVSPAEAAAAAV